MSPESGPGPVNAPVKTNPIRCTECRRIWLNRAEPWRVYIAVIDGTRTAGHFCPQCASREFED